jgi:hypothetical protein
MMHQVPVAARGQQKAASNMLQQPHAAPLRMLIDMALRLRLYQIG